MKLAQVTRGQTLANHISVFPFDFWISYPNMVRHWGKCHILLSLDGYFHQRLLYALIPLQQFDVSNFGENDLTENVIYNR